MNTPCLLITLLHYMITAKVQPGTIKLMRTMLFWCYSLGFSIDYKTLYYHSKYIVDDNFFWSVLSCCYQTTEKDGFHCKHCTLSDRAFKQVSEVTLNHDTLKNAWPARKPNYWLNSWVTDLLIAINR